MNKKFTILIIGILFLAIAGGAFLWWQSEKEESATSLESGVEGLIEEKRGEELEPLTAEELKEKLLKDAEPFPIPVAVMPDLLIVMKSEKQGLYGNPRFEIAYTPASDLFLITLFDKPLGEVRTEAEQVLLEKADGELDTLCKLNFLIGAPYGIVGETITENIELLNICSGLQKELKERPLDETRQKEGKDKEKVVDEPKSVFEEQASVKDILDLISQQQSDIEKQKEIASKTVFAFFKAVQNQKALGNYIMYFSNTEPGQQIIEEKINKTGIEELKRYDSIKIIKTVSEGGNDMYLKVCSQEGICMAYSTHLSQGQDGQWRICKIEEENLETLKHMSQFQSSTCTDHPTEVVKRFFSILNDDEIRDKEQAMKLLSSQRFRYQYEIEETIKELLKKREYMSFDTIEMPYERTDESIEYRVLAWNSEGDTSTYIFSLEKVKKDTWRISWITKIYIEYGEEKEKSVLWQR